MHSSDRSDERAAMDVEAPSEISNNRCLIVAQMREDGFSGGQIHAVAVKNLLNHSGWSARVITPFSGRAPTRNIVFGLRYLLRPFSKQAAIFWLRFGHDLYLRNSLRTELLRDPNGAIIYAQDPLSAESALAMRRPGLDKVVLVVHFNDSQASEWVARGQIPQNGWVFRQIEDLERRVLPRVDEIIYVSEYMKRRLEVRIPALTAVPAVVIPNFVEVPLPAPEAREADILSIGTLENRKNQVYILRVLGELRRREIFLTATFLGDGEQRQNLEILAQELGLGGAVYFAGYVHNAAGWLHKHRLLVHAAHLENCPVSLIEALASGVPVVAAAVGGIPELVDASTGAVWELDSVRDGADKIEALLSDGTRMARARDNGRLRYEQVFSPQSAGSKLTTTFSELLGNKSQPV